MSLPSEPSHSDLPLGRLELTVDGRRVEAELASTPEGVPGPRYPRWMLRIDGAEMTRGPLTWSNVLDPEVERDAIAAFVRDRRRVAREYVFERADFLRHLKDAGRLGALAAALGVPQGDLLGQESGSHHV